MEGLNIPKCVNEDFCKICGHRWWFLLKKEKLAECINCGHKKNVYVKKEEPLKKRHAPPDIQL